MTKTLNETVTNGGLQFITTGDGYRIAYRLDGPANGPVLVLANSIATTLHMWDRQIPELSKHFRVLRYDFRGHGASDVPVGLIRLTGWEGMSLSRLTRCKSTKPTSWDSRSAVPSANGSAFMLPRELTGWF
ncbi:hypothetical protein LJK87_46255 [Paenibacillus sp. P25]|nr:hypothetical protein LJK87_46255 [Paenibacillus sp. P25]